MITVVPAIIPETKEQFLEEVALVSTFAKIIQVDISDGIFAKNKSWPYNGRDGDFFEKLKTEEVGWPNWDDIEYEIHLMVKNPENVLLDWINTGAAAFVCHIEATNDFQKVVDLCKGKEVSLGVAIKPSTNISEIENFISQVDFIQCMGSDDIGHHGAEFNPIVLDRIKELRKSYPERIIAIDIGVTEEIAQALVEAGANKLVSGGAVLHSANPEQTLRFLESL